ncbi:MAG: tetratricopeptide repeat protein [Chitinophagaceae bacterium]
MGKLLLCFCFWIPIPCFAQQLREEIDSLLRLLNHAGMDTNRVNLLTEISFDYYSVDPEKGLAYAGQALALATRLHFAAGMAKAYSRQSINYWALGNDSLAMAAITKSLALYKVSGNSLNYAKTLNNRALNYYNLDNYIAAIHDHGEALAIFEKLHFVPGIQQSWSNMGVVFLALNDYPRALDAFLRAQRAALNDSTAQANIASNIGLVYKNLKDYPKALRYQRQSLDAYRSMGNRQGEANALGNIATIYDMQGRPDRAINYYRQALVINKDIGNNRRIASDLTNIGVVYNAMHRLDSANIYLRNAVTVYKTTNDRNGLSEALLSLSDTYQNTDPQRLSLQKEALAAAKESASPLRQSEAFQALGETYQQEGDYARALAYFRQHVTLRDSIFNAEKEKDITRQQMEFDFEKRDALSKAEIQRQSTIKKAILAGGTLLLLGGTTGFVLYKRRRDAVNRQKEAEWKALASETELKALRAQMNPHFVFNSLNSIGDYILKNNNEQAQEYLSQFASLMRMVLTHSEQDFIPLRDDLQFIELYLQVESKRLPGRFSYAVHVAADLDTDNIMVPPLLLQPFVENSIWHGFKQKETAGHILVEIKKLGEVLVCVVDDNGEGRNVDVENKRKSFGISITENRLKILNQQRNATAALHIIDKENKSGTRIEIALPLTFAF